MPRGPCGEKRPADVIDRVGRLLVALLLAVLVAAAIIAQIPPLGPIEGYGVAFCRHDPPSAQVNSNYQQPPFQTISQKKNSSHTPGHLTAQLRV